MPTILKKRDGSRDWNDVSINVGTPRTTGNHQKLGEKHRMVSPFGDSKTETKLLTF